MKKAWKKFLMVPEHVQYLACLHSRASDVLNALICDRYLSAAQALFELADQSFFPSRVRAVADIPKKNPQKPTKKTTKKTCAASRFGVERMPQCRLMPKL